jgi:rod shape-determining protein MreC
MQRIVNILIVFKEYVVLALLIVISLIILSINDNNQIRAIRSYTVGFVGVIQDGLSIIPNVFELKRENEILRQLDVNLSNEVSLLREARLENVKLRAMLGMSEKKSFALVAGDVVGKSLLLLRNTITLNVGERDSVKVDMPIISEAGLVGKIIATSTRYSVGQLLLNKDFRASAKIQRSRVDGIISWEGGDALRMKNVSRAQDVKEGDVVTTSEYSDVFPRDIRIGIVIRVTEKPGSLFKEVEVTPSVELATLEQVFVVTAHHDDERSTLEKKVSRVK